MKVRVTESGRVTIPKRLRDRLGIEPGTVLEFSEENGRPIAVKSGAADPLSEVYGGLGKIIATDSFMAELRGRKRLRGTEPTAQ